MDLLTAEYRVCARPDEISDKAKAIAWEQTVESPEALVTDPRLLSEVVGQVLNIRALEGADDLYWVKIGYNAALASGQIPQLMNLLYGNISMYPGVRLTGLDLPNPLLAQFPGPRFGIDGLRRLTGTYARPLLATAIKPRGLSIEALATMAGEFAGAGGDIVKDDQNIVDAQFSDFAKRITACRDKVFAANQKTGRNCLYFPYLCAPVAELDRQLELICGLGLKGVLVTPMVHGLDVMRWVSADYGLAVMAHPALTGSYTNHQHSGIAHDVLLGSLFRLAGADISVFPGFGGRISYSHDDTSGIADALRNDLGSLKRAFPCPAGGKGLNQIDGMIKDSGQDSVFLIGGALLSAPGGVASGTHAFLEKIREHSEERLVAPELDELQPESLPSGAAEPLPDEQQLLAFCDDFSWQGRKSTAYKLDSDSDFKSARRVELVGKNGEPCSFELRYFELAPGGYTSLEKHVHIHAVIVARGAGEIRIDGNRRTLNEMDVAVIGPMQTHQLSNPGDSPFGFFCIVDKDRDSPIAV